MECGTRWNVGTPRMSSNSNFGRLQSEVGGWGWGSRAAHQAHGQVQPGKPAAAHQPREDRLPPACRRAALKRWSTLSEPPACRAFGCATAVHVFCVDCEDALAAALKRRPTLSNPPACHLFGSASMCAPFGPVAGRCTLRRNTYTPRTAVKGAVSADGRFAALKR